MNRHIAFISLVWIVYALGIFPSPVQAQPYPSHPIQIVIPNDPGAAADSAGRVSADELGRLLKTSAVVLNKPGASSTLGTEFVVKSKKDGYTIVYAPTSAIIYARATNPEIVPYDPGRDLEPLGLHCLIPLTVAVQESSPWKTFNEFIDHAKKNPGSVRFGIHGQGSIDHFNLEIIKTLTGTQFTIIPFKGTPQTVTALLGGHVEATLTAQTLVRPHAKAGKLRNLLMTVKNPEFPNVPTITELGYGQKLPSGWFAWFAPAGISDDVKRVLVPAIEKMIKTPEVVQKIEKLGLIVGYEPPEELRKIVTSEYEVARGLALKLGLGK
jgi:tripartite-type tricarboxylate transporter receptor subunit TctC